MVEKERGVAGGSGVNCLLLFYSNFYITDKTVDTISNLKQHFFTNWTFMRWLRLSLGIFVAHQAIVSQDLFAGLIASFLLLQALSNTGCCGASGCSVPASTKKNTLIDDVDFEEIKASKV